MATRKIRKRISSDSSDEQSLPASNPLALSDKIRSSCRTTLNSNMQRSLGKEMKEVSLYEFSLVRTQGKASKAYCRDPTCNCADVKENNFYFVIPRGKTELTISSQMREAYKGCLEKGFPAFWIEECAAVDYEYSNRGSLFVLEDFNSTAFSYLEYYMKKNYCLYSESLVIGPLVLLHTFLKNEHSFFHCGYPIFNLAFSGVNVSISGFKNPEKDDLITLIRRMGGFYHPKYVNTLTHMITNNVFSDKAVEAARRKLPLMKMEWVNAVWERSCTKLVRATDAEFACYKAPIFYNVKASFSQFNNHTKAKFQRYIEENGGSVTDTMDSKITNLLVARKHEGEKYKHAEMWKIPVVSSEWILESIKNGYVVSIKDHTVLCIEQKYPMNSTPLGQQVHLPHLSACSIIPKSSMSNLALDSSMFLSQLDITPSNTEKGTEVEDGLSSVMEAESKDSESSTISVPLVNYNQNRHEIRLRKRPMRDNGKPTMTVTKPTNQDERGQPSKTLKDVLGKELPVGTVRSVPNLVADFMHMQGINFYGDDGIIRRKYFDIFEQNAKEGQELSDLKNTEKYREIGMTCERILWKGRRKWAKQRRAATREDITPLYQSMFNQKNIFYVIPILTNLHLKYPERITIPNIEDFALFCFTRTLKRMKKSPEDVPIYHANQLSWDMVAKEIPGLEEVEAMTIKEETA